MDTIRVLHVLHTMDYAGTETLLMNLYRNIDRRAVQFDFAVCSDKEGDYDKEILELGGRIIHYPKYKVYNHREYTRWWNEFFKSQTEYHIVHGHIGSTAAIYLSIAKKNGCYTIAHSHATNSTSKRLKDIAYKAYSYPTRFIADYFMGCSLDAIKDRYGKRIASDRTKSTVFLNAVDSEKFIYNREVREEVRKELGINIDDVVLGTVGRLTIQKNPLMILNIVYRLKEKGIIFRFLWFGKGEMEEVVSRRIKESNLDDTVIMGGVRPDINRMLQAMDIFIFPSLWEGLGITCVEAQAADLKCFCSDVIPAEAIITEKFTALPVDDTEIWAEEIIEYINKGNHSRRDRTEDIRKAGYEISEQSKWLQELYLEKRKNGKWQ